LSPIKKNNIFIFRYKRLKNCFSLIGAKNPQRYYSQDIYILSSHNHGCSTRLTASSRTVLKNFYKLTKFSNFVNQSLQISLQSSIHKNQSKKIRCKCRSTKIDPQKSQSSDIINKNQSMGIKSSISIIETYYVKAMYIKSSSIFKKKIHKNHQQISVHENQCTKIRWSISIYKFNLHK
jgi:hypothetical protein